ncbi:type II toxin-antitoxin system antitoxin SocA domain-containing protein [Haloarcula sp. CBA1122]|uniref:type II toxin-antitoxin system antitoxin SocA domain-containing protein n=1 Tax=Haloarcula sp. CBA1122 TaxID=2668069 RepID=UPI001307A73F|nr:type II toxin-antitoxin system antitoxin SocA domain-containing protein [Haloarcula sp. CBA1122]MUV49295.1 hypothetical protein [Haloarcula sp. CBA1122]
MVELSDLSEREKWILRLLYAPIEGGSSSIEGKTRIVKGLFLIDRMFQNKLGGFAGTGFEFQPYKYGPFDESIYHALDRLEEDNLIEKHVNGQYQGNEFRLTVDGERLAREAFEELDEEEQELLIWIKGKHINQPVAQLLSFVYNRYPDMAENSEYTA